MGTFLRSRHPLDDEQAFVQGAGRLLLADVTDPLYAYPAGVEDLLDLSSGATQYDAMGPWFDAGFTKTGINISRNHAEDTFDVDQSTGAIRRRPNNWEMSVGTQLAEGTLETFQLAWELGPITTVTKTAPQLSERHVGLSAPTSYKERAVAVVFQFPDATIRAYVFRKATLNAQESAMTLNKTGDQVSLPTSLNCEADPTVSTDIAFGEIFEQVPAP